MEQLISPPSQACRRQLARLPLEKERKFRRWIQHKTHAHTHCILRKLKLIILFQYIFLQSRYRRFHSRPCSWAASRVWRQRLRKNANASIKNIQTSPLNRMSFTRERFFNFSLSSSESSRCQKILCESIKGHKNERKSLWMMKKYSID